MAGYDTWKKDEKTAYAYIKYPRMMGLQGTFKQYGTNIKLSLMGMIIQNVTYNL